MEDHARAAGLRQYLPPDSLGTRLFLVLPGTDPTDPTWAVAIRQSYDAGWIAGLARATETPVENASTKHFSRASLGQKGAVQAHVLAFLGRCAGRWVSDLPRCVAFVRLRAVR